MKILTILGIILIVIGVIALVYGGITYTSHKNVVDMGAMHLEVDQKNNIPLSPIAGILAIAAGVSMVVIDRRRSGRGSVV